MRILHCADLHIDSPLLGLERYEGLPVGEIRSATRSAVERLVAFATAPESRVDVVTIGGDIFDGGWRDVNTGLWWNQRLGELADAGIEVYVVHGNHDADSVISHRIAPPPGVVVFGSAEPGTEVSEDLGIAVHGQSYAKAATLENLAAGFPSAVPDRFNIGLLHTSLDGREGHANYAPCAREHLEQKGYALWALGHVHTREHTTDHGVHVLFPGNLQARHARETGPKGATVITTDGTTIASLEHIDLDVVRWVGIPIDVAGMNGADEVVGAVVNRALEEHGTAARTLVARVVLTGAGPAHPHLTAHIDDVRTQIRADLAARSGGAVGLERIVDRTTAPATGDEVRSDAVEAIEELVGRAMEDPEVLARLGSPLGEVQTKVRALLPRLADIDDQNGLRSPTTLQRYLPVAAELLIARLEEG